MPTRVDTVALARRLVRDEVPDCRLDTLASRLRLDHRPTHRALDDALATTDLLHVLIERATGLGVLGLDDLTSLASMAGHPQAGKLRLTAGLPRSPGVYLFCGHRDEVLYVGKATNLRQRVRSYFGSEDRRRIGPMLREAQAVRHHCLPDPLVGRGDRGSSHRPAQAAVQPGRHPRRPLLLHPPRHRLALAASGGREGCRCDGGAPRPAAVADDGRAGRRRAADGVAAATLLGAPRSAARPGRGRHSVRTGATRRRRLPVRRRWPTGGATTSRSVPRRRPSRGAPTPWSSG